MPAPIFLQRNPGWRIAVASLCSSCQSVLGCHIPPNFLTKDVIDQVLKSWAAPGGEKLVELFGDIVDLHNVLQAQHKPILLQQLHLPPLRLQPMVVRPRLGSKIRSSQRHSSVLMHAQGASDTCHVDGALRLSVACRGIHLLWSTQRGQLQCAVGTVNGQPCLLRLHWADQMPDMNHQSRDLA